MQFMMKNWGGQSIQVVGYYCHCIIDIYMGNADVT